MLAEEGRLLVEGLFLLVFRLNYYCDSSFIFLLSVVLTFKTIVQNHRNKSLGPFIQNALCLWLALPSVECVLLWLKNIIKKEQNKSFSFSFYFNASQN